MLISSSLVLLLSSTLNITNVVSEFFSSHFNFFRGESFGSVLDFWLGIGGKNFMLVRGKNLPMKSPLDLEEKENLEGQVENV